ncbi:MAG: metallophosphoesterase [Clostridia bacterium]|nr:metallophosphoesterase [Clostridia bacterium]
MKTITVVSDSHGNRAIFERLATQFSESDYIFHLGDTSADGKILEGRYPGKTYILNGNCDGTFPQGEDEMTLQIEGVTIFMCHGHKYGAKSGLTKIYARAKEVGATLALYGHTHKALETELDGVTILNPGTLSRYSYNSYAYVIVSGDKFTCKIVDVT